jgi:hypothetical protein
MNSFPTCAHLSIMAAAVLLCPVLAFLMAIGVEILIGVLRDPGCSSPRLLRCWRARLVAASHALGPAGSAPAET